MSKKLYIGNLPYSCDDQQLNDLATPYGEVTSAAVIKDKFSGQSKGFGFVEMTDDTAALKAIEELDGREMGGRNLKVNEARPMAPREGGGGGGGFGRNRSGGGGGGGRGPRREGGGGGGGYGGGGGGGGYGGGGGGGGGGGRDRNRGNRW